MDVVRIHTLRTGGSTEMPMGLAREASLEISFSGMVSVAMRSLEGELFARPMSCTTWSSIRTPFL